MGNIKENLRKVYDECTELYEQGGVGAVCDHVNVQMQACNPLYDDVKYKYCTPCDAGQPVLNGVCLVCGSAVYPEIGRKIITIGDVRELIADLNDDDIAVIEACDEDGEVEDLYPMYIDVIEGIELLNGKTVNEVRFCQMPNVKPEVQKPEIVAPVPDMEKIETFAVAMSVMLYELRSESETILILTTPNSDHEVPEDFIISIIDDEEHAHEMRLLIKNDIVHHLTECPDDWKNDEGEYENHIDIYDLSMSMDAYVERLYEDTHETKTLWVCPDCGSDNVQFKTWTDANSFKATNDECPMEDGDCACKDCESTSVLITKEMIPRRKLIGFQVNAIDGVGHEYMHPLMKDISSVYNLSQAGEMMLNTAGDIDSKLITIWTDDIECPTMMFEGNVR